MSNAAHDRILVLVVEDEPFVRMDAVDIVEEAGFAALEAANADEALRLLELRPDIRIVFTDIEMPGSMNGLALARTISERWPPIAIMVASGRLRPASHDIPMKARFFSNPTLRRRSGTR